MKTITPDSSTSTNVFPLAHKRIVTLIPARFMQRGIALAMSLIFLLILTLFAVVSMNTGTMQEKMAGNMRDQDVALQAAESALLYAHQVLFTALEVTPEPQCPDAVNNIWCANTVDWKTPSWWDANGISYRGDGAKQIAEAYEDPRMAIEKSWFAKDDKDSSSTSGIQYYRLIARGRGASGVSETVVHWHVGKRKQ